MVAEAKRRYLDRARVRGKRLSQGARWWFVFCVHVLGVSPFQPRFADEQTRALYESWLEDMAVWLVTFRPSGRFISAKSAGKYVSEVRGWYRVEVGGVLGAGAASSRIQAILDGVAREIPQPPKRERRGVRPADLRGGYRRRHPQRREPRSAMWRAATAFGLALLARGCEFALDDSRGEVFTPSENLTPADVRFFTSPGGVRHARVRMRKRKDLKVLTGKHHVVVLGGGGSVLDPVDELAVWLEVRAALGLPDDGPLFCWPDGSCITVSEVRAEVRALMEAVGLDAMLYGAHSLRIGGATAALAAGVPPAMIRLMGRWSSDIYEIYCHMSEQAAMGVGTAICSAEEVQLLGGFEEEHLELLPQELELVGPRGGAGGGGDDDDDEDAA